MPFLSHTSRDLAATDKELRGMFPSARPPSPVMGASGTAASVLRAPAPSYQATGTKAFTIVIPSKVCALPDAEWRYLLLRGSRMLAGDQAQRAAVTIIRRHADPRFTWPKSETLERPDRLPGEVYNQITQELDERKCGIVPRTSFMLKLGMRLLHLRP